LSTFYYQFNPQTHQWEVVHWSEGFWVVVASAPTEAEASDIYQKLTTEPEAL
jgi:sucrose-6-phosphate hydrolase SacC (GH32 family)